MDTALAWLATAFEEDPVYWAGIATWTLGFALYLYSGFVSARPKLNTLGAALCWVGFLATALAPFMPLDAPDGGQFQLPPFDLTLWQSAGNLI